MDVIIWDWLSYAVRFVHVITGIAWIWAFANEMEWSKASAVKPGKFMAAAFTLFKNT